MRRGSAAVTIGGGEASGATAPGRVKRPEAESAGLQPRRPAQPERPAQAGELGPCAGAAAGPGGARRERSLPARQRRGACGCRGQIGLAGRGERAIDLGFDQNVVRTADHDQMLDVVAPDQHKLPLSVEAESVDETQSRLSRPAARNPQPMRENEPVEDRQNHQGGEAASREEADLNHSVVGERKVT